MTLLLKAVAAKPDDLMSISKIYKAEREDQLLQQPFDCPFTGAKIIARTFKRETKGDDKELCDYIDR